MANAEAPRVELQLRERVREQFWKARQTAGIELMFRSIDLSQAAEHSTVSLDTVLPTRDELRHGFYGGLELRVGARLPTTEEAQTMREWTQYVKTLSTATITSWPRNVRRISPIAGTDSDEESTEITVPGRIPPRQVELDYEAYGVYFHNTRDGLRVIIPTSHETSAVLPVREFTSADIAPLFEEGNKPPISVHGSAFERDFEWTGKLSRLHRPQRSPWAGHIEESGLVVIRSRA
ncbi:hypothetical protein HYS00_03850 [Candidatus Microgenomates bacterium]|nr:hypothetical protein [Candidatus Microgenomates bacterium]